MSFRRPLLILAAFAMLAFGPAGASPAAAEKIVLRVAGEFPPRAAGLIEQTVAAFNSQHADIEVVLHWRPAGPDALLKEFFSGDRPDVLGVPSWVALELARCGALDLRSIQRMAANPDDYPPDVWRAAQFASGPPDDSTTRPMGLPWMADTVQVIFNADLFSRARCSPGDPPLIKADIPRLCERLQRGLGTSPEGPFALGLAAAPPDISRTFASFLHREGGTLTLFDAADGTIKTGLDTEAGRRAFAAMLQLKPFAPPDATAVGREQLARQFAEGRYALLFGSLQDLDAILAAQPGLAVRTAGSPVGPASTCTGDVAVLVLPKRCGASREHTQAAIELLRFLTGPEAQTLLMTGADTNKPCALPVLRELLEGDWYRQHPLYRPFARGLNNCAPAVPHAGWHIADQRAVGRALCCAYAEEIPPDTALGEAGRKANSVLASYYGQVGHASETMVLGLSFLAVVLFVVMAAAIGYRR